MKIDLIGAHVQLLSHVHVVCVLFKCCVNIKFPHKCGPTSI